jgi:hypothetical protein
MTTETETPSTGPEARGDFIKDDAPTPEVEVEEVLDEAVEPVEETTPEVTEEPDEQPRDEKGKFVGKGIPKERFDQAVGKERAAREAAEARAATLEAQLSARVATQQSQEIEKLEAQVVDLEAQYAAALVDGNIDKAAELVQQIRRAERTIVRIEVRDESRTATAQTLESDRIELAIAKLEADHSVLNPGSEDYNEPLVNFVLAEQTRLMKTEQLSPSRALQKAATEILERFGPKVAVQAEEPQGLAKLQGERKAAAVKKNLAAQAAQPGSMRDVGLDSDKAGLVSKIPDINKLSREEYAALPAATRARMRGDNLHSNA